MVLLFTVVIMFASGFLAPAHADCSGLIGGDSSYPSRRDSDLNRFEIKSYSEILEGNSFAISRGYGEYAEVFSDSFKAIISRLTSNLSLKGIWMDMGAGTARAELELLAFLRSQYPAQTPLPLQCLAFGKKMPRPEDETITTANSFGVVKEIREKEMAMQRKSILALKEAMSKLPKDEFDYHEGLIEFSSIAHLPKADLITDLFGALTYTENLGKLLQRYFDLLKKDGEMYIAYDANSLHIRHEGKDQELVDFLNNIVGVKASVINHHSDLTVIRVTKQLTDIHAPVTKGKVLRDGTPPEMRHEY